MNRFFSIARLAAMEAIRSPLFLLAAYSVAAAITAFPFLLNFTLGDSARMVVSSAFSLFFMSGILLAILSVSTTLSAELRKGTAGVILSKPVPRHSFLLAQATGIATALLAYSLLMLTATLLAVRTASSLQADWGAAGPALAALLLAPALAGVWNHHTRRPFTTAAFFLLLVFFGLAMAAACFIPARDTLAVFPVNMPAYILPTGMLLCLPILMAVGIATLFAIQLEPTPALLLSLLLLSLGLLADYLLGGALTASWSARAAYALLPNIQAFWLMDALDARQPIPALYFFYAAAYATAYTAACLAAACFFLRRKEIT